jgi:hypothetical protein
MICYSYGRDSPMVLLAQKKKKFENLNAEPTIFLYLNNKKKLDRSTDGEDKLYNVGSNDAY